MDTGERKHEQNSDPYYISIYNWTNLTENDERGWKSRGQDVTSLLPAQVFSTEKVSIFVMEFRFPDGLSRLTRLAAPVATA